MFTMVLCFVASCDLVGCYQVFEQRIVIRGDVTPLQLWGYRPQVPSKCLWLPTRSRSVKRTQRTTPSVRQDKAHLDKWYPEWDALNLWGARDVTWECGEETNHVGLDLICNIHILVVCIYTCIYCNEFAGSLPQWKFITLQSSIHNSWLQFTTLLEF
jgi:hypothetical protein